MTMEGRGCRGSLDRQGFPCVLSDVKSLAFSLSCYLKTEPKRWPRIKCKKMVPTAQAVARQYQLTFGCTCLQELESFACCRVFYTFAAHT
jgi:hypothetical protein